MRFLRNAAVLGAILLATQSDAATRETCQTMARALSSVAPALRAFSESMKGADTTTIALQFSNQEREALLKFEELRKQVLPLMVAFASQAEDTAYLMQKCAR